jgi:hypothetical protein
MSEPDQKIEIKIGYKFWIFLIIFSIFQCLIALSINYRISSESTYILNKLSDQIVCQLGGQDACEYLKEQERLEKINE